MQLQVAKNLKIHGLFLAFLLTNLFLIPTSAIAQKKVCILTDAGKKICGKVVQSDTSIPIKASQPPVTIEYKSGHTINVQLVKCYRATNKIQCKFLVDRVDQLSETPIIGFISNDLSTDFSQATDSQNKDYIASQIMIGTRTEGTHINVEFSKGRTVSAILSFPIAQKISVIKKISFGIKKPLFFNELMIANFSNVNISE
jgi:hypothetical protein